MKKLAAIFTILIAGTYLAFSEGAEPNSQDSKLEFHTWTNMGFQNAWSTVKGEAGDYENDFSEESSGF